MLTAVVARTGASVDVRLIHTGYHATVVAASEEEAATEVPEKDLNPIFPEMKEIAWGFGSFVVFAVLMRFFLFPRLKRGMDARYASIRSNVEGADAVKAAAQAEVAEYQSQLAAVKAEATAKLDAARQTLEAERAGRIAEVNGRIAERRSAAVADADAARAAARGQIESAVGSVASRAVELAIGSAPSADAVRSAVSSVMSAEVAR